MTTNAFHLIQRDVVTPATIVLAAVVGVSGVMLFFHLRSGLVRDAHEWLGLGFVAVSALHVWRHWQPATGYVRRPLGRLGFAVTALVASLLIGLSASPGPSPQRAAVRHLLDAPLGASAPALGLSAEAAAARLAGLGVRSDTGQSLDALARAAERSPIELLQALTAPTGG